MRDTAQPVMEEVIYILCVHTDEPDVFQIPGVSLKTFMFLLTAVSMLCDSNDSHLITKSLWSCATNVSYCTPLPGSLC